MDTLTAGPAESPRDRLNRFLSGDHPSFARQQFIDGLIGRSNRKSGLIDYTPFGAGFNANEAGTHLGRGEFGQAALSGLAAAPNALIGPAARVVGRGVKAITGAAEEAAPAFRTNPMAIRDEHDNEVSRLITEAYQKAHESATGGGGKLVGPAPPNLVDKSSNVVQLPANSNVHDIPTRNPSMTKAVQAVIDNPEGWEADASHPANNYPPLSDEDMAKLNQFRLQMRGQAGFKPNLTVVPKRKTFGQAPPSQTPEAALAPTSGGSAVARPSSNSGLVVARKMPDGSIKYGKPGDMHIDLIGDDELERKGVGFVGMDENDMGWAKPGGPFMSREQAAAHIGQATPLESSAYEAVGRPQD